jgi:aminocarboxymuconate-semialdehyde decarboxylase
MDRKTKRCILAAAPDILPRDFPGSTLENLAIGGIHVTIDVHAHYFPSEYLDRLDLYGGSHVTGLIRKMKLGSADFSGLDDHLRNMDRSKVETQILSVSGQLPYFGRESEAVDAARLGNDIYARIVREFPKRFAAFACTPLPHVRASIEETGRALDELGMVGVTTGTVVLGKSIADPAFNEFFVELNRRKAVLFIHPTGGALGSQLIESTKLVWPVGAPLEDTVCLLQFMQSNFPLRFPDIKIILPHLGGFAPFLAVRLDQLKDHFLPDSAMAPSVQAKYFWYDTVNGNPAALRCARETLGADHLLMGTDYPFWRDDAFKLCVDYVGESGLPVPEVDRILRGNAKNLLGL